jgi:hypothetical protein
MQREQAGLPPVIPEHWKNYDKQHLDDAIRTRAISEYMKKQIVMKQLVSGYQKLWDDLNGKRDGGAYLWKCNPWVKVVVFERRVSA